MKPIQVMLGYRAEPEELQIIEESWPPEVMVVFPKTGDPDGFKNQLHNIEAIVGDLPAEYLLEAANLKLIHTIGHGLNALLKPQVRQFLLEKKVVVAKASPAAVPIAEFIIASLVILTRRIWQMHSNLVYNGSWSEATKASRMKGSMGGELQNSVLGIMGFGAIGRETAIRARAFGMTTGTLTRNPAKIDQEKYGISFTASSQNDHQIVEFLQHCDYVVNLMPLTPETRDFMDKNRFAAMKEGAYFINISRGPIIVEEALWEALRSGKLAGAAADVWCSEEQPGPRGYPTLFPLHQYNVLMTPHYAGATKEVRARALRTIGANLRRWLQNEPLHNLANLEDGY